VKNLVVQRNTPGKNGHWGTQAEPGAVVYFSWDDKSADSIDHMGLVKKDNGAGTITTVEGNTGNGKVEQRILPTSQVVGLRAGGAVLVAVGPVSRWSVGVDGDAVMVVGGQTAVCVRAECAEQQVQGGGDPQQCQQHAARDAVRRDADDHINKISITVCMSNVYTW
jgi:hypothetical protein